MTLESSPDPSEQPDTDKIEAEDEPEQESDAEILEKARLRLALTEEAEMDIRAKALDDLKFRSGKQWPDNVEMERNRDGRPCLVINRLPQFVQQITNDQRQNRPSIKVHPLDNAADVETGKIIQGILRHIEYTSNAETAYDTAFESACTSSFGYFRLITDFVSSKSFDQEILIKRIRNQFSVFFDPYAQEPDGSDADWVFITEDLSADEFRSKYPDSKLSASGADWVALGNNAPGWIKSDSVRVAEYFYKTDKDDTIHLLSTGETVFESEREERIAKATQAGLDCRVVKTRQTKTTVIKWCKINGSEILEQTDWIGSYIPVIPVYGAELFVDGKRILESVIRHAKDPQRMYNYWKSAETETIALAPRAPFIGAEGQFEGHEQEWAMANRRNHAYLTYKQTALNGQNAPPPQRQAFEPAVQAISQASMMAADDLKATTGIYDASLGAGQPETSGVAIQRRTTQTQTSNFHYIDNLHRSIRHAGRVLVDLIPKIYDTARAARIVGPDGEQKIVQVNQQHEDESGKQVLYALDVGRYDVTIDTGPSFASKRQETAASMLDLSKAYPKLMEIAGDILVKRMDWDGAQEIGERIKKTMPPGIVDDPKKQQIPPQVQAQMQQMGQMIDALTQHLHAASQVIETKKMDLEHRERVEIMKLQVNAEIEMAKMGSQESMALLKHEVGAITARLKLLDNDEPIGADNPNLSPQESGGNAGPVDQPPTGGQSPGQPVEGTP